MSPLCESIVSDHEDFRCADCGKLLAIRSKSGGVFEVKCPRCNRLNVLLETMPDHVVITNGQVEILFINSTVEEVSGYTIAEAIGKKPSALWGGHMGAEFYRDLFARLSASRSPVKTVMTNRKKNGELYQIEFQITPVFDINDDYLIFIGIGRVI